MTVTLDRKTARLATPAHFSPDAVRDISAGLSALLADMFALYIKTKNFHWHVSGAHFLNDHELFDAQAAEILGSTDDVAERARKIGGTTLRSIGQIAAQKRILDNDAPYVTPLDMLAELRDDNNQLVASMRTLHDVCDEHGDVATASLLEELIDAGEKRVWFLFESARRGKDD